MKKKYLILLSGNIINFDDKLFYHRRLVWCGLFFFFSFMRSSNCQCIPLRLKCIHTCGSKAILYFIGLVLFVCNYDRSNLSICKCQKDEIPRKEKFLKNQEGLGVIDIKKNGRVDYREYKQTNFNLSRGTIASSSGLQSKEKAQAAVGDTFVKTRKMESKNRIEKLRLYQTHLSYPQLQVLKTSNSVFNLFVKVPQRFISSIVCRWLCMSVKLIIFFYCKASNQQ